MSAEAQLSGLFPPNPDQVSFYGLDAKTCDLLDAFCIIINFDV